jgi:hypothetical protein
MMYSSIINQLNLRDYHTHNYQYRATLAVTLSHFTTVGYHNVQMFLLPCKKVPYQHDVFVYYNQLNLRDYHTHHYQYLTLALTLSYFATLEETSGLQSQSIAERHQAYECRLCRVDPPK